MYATDGRELGVKIKTFVDI